MADVTPEPYRRGEKYRVRPSTEPVAVKAESKPHPVRREDLSRFRARLEAYRTLTGLEDPPISWGTWCDALDVYEEALRDFGAVSE